MGGQNGAGKEVINRVSRDLVILNLSIIVFSWFC